VLAQLQMALLQIAKVTQVSLLLSLARAEADPEGHARASVFTTSR
jgi:hypothetical protein